LFESRFAGAEEERGERDAAGSYGAGNFGLRFEGGQGDGSVSSGEGVGDVAAEGGGVADLRSGDQVTGFDQGLGVATNQKVTRDAVDRDGGADVEFVPAQFEGGHLRDEGQVN
jgi:hypothetical protein